MPRIQEYTRQVSPSGPTGRMIQADTRAQNALANVGNSIANFGQNVARWEDQRDTFEAQKQAVKLRDQLDKELNEAKLKAPPGARNFSEFARTHLETRRNQALEQMGDLTPNAQKVFERSLLEIDSKFQAEARAFEADALAKETVTFIKESEENSRNTVRANPAKLDEYLIEQTKLNSAAPGVSEHWKAERNQEVSRALHDAALDGIVTTAETNPRTTIGQVDALIADMKNEKSRWIKGTTNPEYDRDLSRLQRLRETLIAKRQQFITTDFKERMDQIEKTGVDNGHYTSQWIKSNISDPELQKQMLYREATAREVGKVVATTGAMPIGDLVSRVRAANDKQSLGDSNTFYKDASVASAYQVALENRTKAWAADPAGYTLSVSAAAKSADEAFLKNPTPETSRVRNETIIAEQSKMYPGEMPSIVTKERAAQIQSILAKIPQTGKGAEEALAVLQTENELHGNFWPIAVKDLRREKAINSTQYVAASMLSDPTKKWFAEDLVRASVMKRDDLTKQIPVSGAVESARLAAVEALKPLTDSLGGMADGTKIQADYVDALIQYILYKGAQAGDDLSGQAEDYARKVVLDSYDFKGSYRVPVSQNSGAVERVTKALVDTSRRSEFNNVKPIFYEDLVIPPSMNGLREKDAKEVYVNRLKDYGRFVNDNDDGIRFVDEFDNPVYVKKDGKATQLKWTWDDVKVLDSTLSKKPFLNPIYTGERK